VRRLPLLAAAFLLSCAAACGGSSEPAADQATSPAVTSEPEPETTKAEPEPTTGEETTTEAEPPAPQAPPGVPDFVAGYRSWTKLNDTPIPPHDADPHNGTKNVYVSKEQLACGRYPRGTG